MSNHLTTLLCRVGEVKAIKGAAFYQCMSRPAARVASVVFGQMRTEHALFFRHDQKEHQKENKTIQTNAGFVCLP